METFLVERYWPGVTFEAFSDAARRVLEAVEELRGEGAPVRAASTTLVPGDEAVYWIVDAPSADLVEVAYQRAGVPVERIVAALDLRPVARLRPVGPGRTGEGRGAATSASNAAGPGAGRGGEV